MRSMSGMGSMSSVGRESSVQHEETQDEHHSADGKCFASWDIGLFLKQEIFDRVTEVGKQVITAVVQSLSPPLSGF